MRRKAQTDEAHRTVRATSDEIRSLLDEMDSAPRDPHSAERESKRFGYRVPSCTIRLQQPGAPAPTTFDSPTRNLSDTGMSFLHGGFVHAGSKCRIFLAAEDGRKAEVAGTVVRCRYVERLIHEVSVQFDEKITPAMFGADVTEAERGGAGGAAE